MVKSKHVSFSAINLLNFLSLFVITIVSPITYALELNKDDFLVNPESLPGYIEVERYIADLKTNDGNHYSNILEFYDLPKEMYAGRLTIEQDETITEDERKLFFWKFTRPDSFKKLSDTPNINDNNKLMFWLNGGPGCSSMDGVFMETGPFRLNDKNELIINPGSWHTKYDMVYLDQPLGTGFSHKSESSSLENVQFYDGDLAQDVSKHFIQFLNNYFKLFPEDLSKEIYLSGESYAGQYIPFFANEILNYNLNNDDDAQKINLKKLYIGNGWVDPDRQSLSYLPFALKSGLITETNEHFRSILDKHEKCQNLINTYENVDEEKFSYDQCESILSYLLQYTRDTGTKQCYNMYDIRLRDSYPSCGMNWPPLLPNIIDFFNKPGVLEALNIVYPTTSDSFRDELKWHECDDMVLWYLTNPYSKPSIHLLPDILENDIDIVFFNGDRDLICNNEGVLSMINNLGWKGSTGFVQEEGDNIIWKHNGEEAGYVKSERGVTFISIKDASHMAAYDKPLEVRGILDIADIFDAAPELKELEEINTNDINIVIPEGQDSDNEKEQAEEQNTQDDEENDNANSEEEFEEVNEEEEEEEEDQEDEGAIEGDNEDDEDEYDEDESDEDEGDVEEDEDENNEEEDDDEEEEEDDDEEEEEDDEEEEEDEDDKEGKGEENKDNNKENTEKSKKEHTKFKRVVIYFSLSSILLTIVYYVLRQFYFRPKLRAILINPTDELDNINSGSKRRNANNKSVSWAEDLEEQYFDLENGDSIDDSTIVKDNYNDEPSSIGKSTKDIQDNYNSKKQIKKKKKGGAYTSIPNDTETSFELDDM
ncbi:serine-type carboxypeptidase SCDLUD_002356 [Saccharomycodes ludwigii]|uniref:serine-type carboxypeptidase n=1 Tax=Saccharomycodes ludwigii TaxID=36035 RepID=UPI001E8BEE5C|nr:hypothetical protein SCDLUD_002356 [Saccharomycodes ludwigii]KAH3900897.1 hypothetical protein SCDLUD_002356 [Saccharomycodes ludwigii]